MKAIQISRFGGPEVLEHTELPDPEPGPGEVVVEVARAGVNFADVHQRENRYLAARELPFVPGTEVAGTVDGRRVAAITMRGGGYAERCAVPEADLVEVPDALTDDQAAALSVQGLTAWFILARSAALRPGESVLVHGAAGGTGGLCVQLARRMGAGRVIGMASSEDKRALVRELGADAAIDSRAPDLAERILEANGGAPVDVVLESTGGAAFEASLEALAPLGRLVAYGIATGEPNEVRTSRLMRESRAVIGFWLVHLLERGELVREGMAELFAAAGADELRVEIGGVRGLSEAAAVHEDLAARRTRGKLLLDPSR